MQIISTGRLASIEVQLERISNHRKKRLLTNEYFPLQ